MVPNKNKLGAEVKGPGTDSSVQMSKWPTVFQAEIYAILECPSSVKMPTFEFFWIVK